MVRTIDYARHPFRQFVDVVRYYNKQRQARQLTKKKYNGMLLKVGVPAYKLGAQIHLPRLHEEAVV